MYDLIISFEDKYNDTFNCEHHYFSTELSFQKSEHGSIKFETEK